MLLVVRHCLLLCCIVFLYFFFFKQKTAYEMRISDWSSDVCSSDLQERLKPLLQGFGGQDFSAGVSGAAGAGVAAGSGAGVAGAADGSAAAEVTTGSGLAATCGPKPKVSSLWVETIMRTMLVGTISSSATSRSCESCPCRVISTSAPPVSIRSEEHTSALQSLMRNSY